MPSNPKTFLRRLMPTAHRLLLEKKIRTRLSSIYGRVLVLGAGYDPYRSMLSNASSVLITDISDDSNQLDMIADAHDLPFDDEEFDCVIALEVFEHLVNPSVASSEMFRVLKPGGKAIISIPFLFHIHGDPHDYNRFTQQGLQTLFGNFPTVHIEEMGGRLAVLSDIFTTMTKILVPFRLINNIFHLSVLSRIVSKDCPSGYWIEAHR